MQGGVRVTVSQATNCFEANLHLGHTSSMIKIISLAIIHIMNPDQIVQTLGPAPVPLCEEITTRADAAFRR